MFNMLMAGNRSLVSPLAFVCHVRSHLRSVAMAVTLSMILCVTIHAQELPLTHYTQDNEVVPLPSADVRSVYQDHQGYVWMVIYSSGLLRYDGHSLETYTIDDGLPDLTVRQVLEDQLGRLWVASNAGLSVSERPLNEYGTNQRIRFSTKIGRTQLLTTFVFSKRMAVDSRGSLWIGTPGEGLIQYRFVGNDSVTVDTVSTDLYNEGKHRGVRSVVVRRDGSIWVGITGGDIMVLNAGVRSYDLLTDQHGAPRVDTEVLFESSSGRLWGGCSNGILWRLTEGIGHRTIEVVDDSLKGSINSIANGPAGTLWAASDNFGVLKIVEVLSGTPQSQPGNHATYYSRRNGYLSDNVYDITEDREGNIWFAQSGGVSKLRANYLAFRNFTANSRAGAPPALLNQAVSSILPPVDGSLPYGAWVGTHGGGIALLGDAGRVGSITTEQGLKYDQVYGLALDQRGRIWIGTDKGINCLSFDAKASPPPRSPVTYPVTVAGRAGVIATYQNTTIHTVRNLPMFEGSDRRKTIESMWLPGYKTIYCFVDDSWFTFRASSGLPPTFYHTVALDNVGRLWVGTRDGGLYRSILPLNLSMLRDLPAQDVAFQVGNTGEKFGREITAQLFEPVWNRDSGAPSNQIETMIWRDGTLWVGTPEGLAIIEDDPPRMTALLTTKDGLRANNATSMAFSPVSGTLWLGTNGGLTEIDPRTRKVLRTVSKQDGLVDNEVWYYGSVVIAGDGTIYFGTAKGLSIYSPQLDKSNTAFPILRFTKANFTESSSGDNEVVFEYAALSFTNEKLVRYKTRMVGYDKDWSAETPEVKIRYTNLPAFVLARSYTFEMVACNNAGLWAETPLQYSITVQPPWWFRWWWLAANVVFLVGVVYSFSRLRIKQLEKRSRELERTVEERTQEIRQKADEINRQAQELAAKNDELVKTQEQLVMQEKLASLGSLTAAIAHEIKNPLNFVNNFAELSKELTQILKQDFGKQKDKIDPDSVQNIDDLLTDLEHNVTKITEHGKRADGIVRGMLLHSQGKSGERLSTDINILLDEYVHLAYHGLRAQDVSLNVSIKTDYDKSIGEIMVVPQNISRVFLNVINNACYAANEKKKKVPPPFTPTVTVCSKNLDDKVEIRVRDNGIGIPKENLDKIFNPFFTTKPTGKGTGLGLSLSYDIVVKEHSGELKVESVAGEYSEFIIILPK
jgi:signal transduction histidine kinase/ligand-binding sensor domain-containing protein